MSQLPNLEAAWWASAIGAAMSLGYSTVAIALGAAEAHNGLGSLTGDARGAARGCLQPRITAGSDAEHVR